MLLPSRLYCLPACLPGPFIPLLQPPPLWLRRYSYVYSFWERNSNRLMRKEISLFKCRWCRQWRGADGGWGWVGLMALGRGERANAELFNYLWNNATDLLLTIRVQIAINLPRWRNRALPLPCRGIHTERPIECEIVKNNCFWSDVSGGAI